MDRRILFDSLIEWMKTLNLNGTEDLSDGRTIALCLNNIDSIHFKKVWLQTIRTDSENNCRIKAKNLNEILAHIINYYSKIFDQSLIDFQMPNLNMIAERVDEIELSRLLQLVLGCAVSCNRKEFYIERIMSMEKSVQHILMNAIQELMIKDNRKSQEDYSEIENQLKQKFEEFNRVIKEKKDIENHSHELSLQISALEMEKLHLIQQTTKLNKCIETFENRSETDTVPISRYRILQEEIQFQQEEILKLEIAVQDCKTKCDTLHEDNENLLKRNDDLMKLADNARILKDELDVFRNECEKMTRLQTTIDSYKIKLEEMCDLRKQIKRLEEKNLRLLEEKSHLEQENKHAKLLQTQVEFHKKTHQELYRKMSELQCLADKTEFEKQLNEEKLKSINEEKLKLIDEIQLLRKRNEQLVNVDPDDVPEEPNSSDVLTGALADLNIFHLPAEIRQHFIRLQHENEMLKLSQTEENNNERVLLLQANYEQLKNRNNQLNNELRVSNQKILELEATANDSENTIEMTNLKKTLNRTVSYHEEESIRIKARINELQKRLENAEKQLIEKDTIISIKTSELAAINERYREYLEKAKMVLRQMVPHNDSSLVNQELHSLRKKSHEKNRKLKDLQKQYEKVKSMKESQEKLFVSAWYSLANQLQPNEFEAQLASHEDNVILQRFLSTQPSPKTSLTSSLPVGTGLSTVQTSSNLPILYQPSLLSRIKLKLGLQGELREPQKVLYQAAAISYYMIGSSVDFDEIQRELEMPDVFASFGRIIFLHVWFLLVRYIQLGEI
ncbi:unnamed protein product [Rotaria socialis]|uniref:Protein hook n=1 Tax=Rotaria socialis TaxID=392032 RepID=A0A821K7L5_9BILA|nr:unnamed protein product [Rotaria socialis]CAF4482650.1 unnamed protein product [Rotaria socialis]CAF4730039.1 unnamed protein product [Rotaria socialis]